MQKILFVSTLPATQLMLVLENKLRTYLFLQGLPGPSAASSPVSNPVMTIFKATTSRGF
jgi:hypothetical protein